MEKLTPTIYFACRW